MKKGTMKRGAMKKSTMKENYQIYLPWNVVAMNFSNHEFSLYKNNKKNHYELRLWKKSLWNKDFPMKTLDRAKD